MPESLFCGRLNPVELSLAQLRGHSVYGEFKTTISATIHRVEDVAVHVCALVRSEGGTLRSFKAGPDFPFRIREMRTELDARSCAGEFFRDGAGVEREADVPADAWLENLRFTGSETVRELTVPMPQATEVRSPCCGLFPALNLTMWPQVTRRDHPVVTPLRGSAPLTAGERKGARQACTPHSWTHGGVNHWGVVMDLHRVFPPGEEILPCVTSLRRSSSVLLTSDIA